MAGEGSIGERELVIRGENKKLDSEDDVVDIVHAISECSGLSVLKLSGNSLGVGACAAIAEALAAHPALTHARWSDIFVSRLKSEIPPALTALGGGVMRAGARLVEMDLSDNAFGPAAVEALTELLTSPSCFSLRELRLNNNGLGIGGGKLLAKALLQCHDEAELAGQRLALEVFVSGRNRLENEGAAALSEVFQRLGSLLHVAMPQNGIQHEGVAALARGLAENPRLQVINLNDNTFTEEGSSAMAAVLPSLQEIRVLNFGDCLMRSEGAAAIAHAIKDGHRLLEELNLSFGELDQAAGLVVADALCNKDNLKRLELNGNDFGEEGIDLLRESLEAKGCLDVLGSLSDDEGIEGEGEEEEEEEGESEEDTSQEESAIVQQNDSLSEQQDEAAEEGSVKVTVEDYLARPSAEKLVALGAQRAQLIVAEAGERLSVERAGELYVTVTSCYTRDCPAPTRAAVVETVDALLRPFCQTGHFVDVLNSILVHIGLLKSEDKTFSPVEDVVGPLLALAHVVRQDYFPRGMEDVLIAFLQKPSPVLVPEPVHNTRHEVLKALFTL